MIRSSERDQLFNRVPGPSPWYLTNDIVPIEGYSWKHTEGGRGGAGGKTLLVGASGIIGVFGFYNYVKVLEPSRLLVWNQKRRGVPRSQSAPVELFLIDLSVLEPITTALERIYERIDAGEGFFALKENPSASLLLQVDDVSGVCYVEFPDAMRSMEELLVLCHTPAASTGDKSADLALMVAEPRASIYRLYPQDWFNKSDRDYSYEWVTRVARNPNTGRIEGEGFRIPPFVLDVSLREVEHVTDSIATSE